MVLPFSPSTLSTSLPEYALTCPMCVPVLVSLAVVGKMAGGSKALPPSAFLARGWPAMLILLITSLNAPSNSFILFDMSLKSIDCGRMKSRAEASAFLPLRRRWAVLHSSGSMLVLSLNESYISNGSKTRPSMLGPSLIRTLFEFCGSTCTLSEGSPRQFLTAVIICE